MNLRLIRHRLISTFTVLVGLFVFTFESAQAEPSPYDVRIYYFYEVGNQIPLSDFALGSDELIKDNDGNGLGFSWVIREGNMLKLELDMGYSRTIYQGEVEDGVDVTFVPQTGSGLEALSQSKNVTYDFDLVFQNPYIGFNAVIGFFRIGGGRILQSVEGDVTLSAENIVIATAEYETKNQLYGQVGFDFIIEAQEKKP